MPEPIDAAPLTPEEREAMLRSLISSWAISGIAVSRETAEISLDAALRRPLPDLDTQQELNDKNRALRLTLRSFWWARRQNEVMHLEVAMWRRSARLLLMLLELRIICRPRNPRGDANAEP